MVLGATYKVALYSHLNLDQYEFLVQNSDQFAACPRARARAGLAWAQVSDDPSGVDGGCLLTAADHFVQI